MTTQTINELVSEDAAQVEMLMEQLRNDLREELLRELSGEEAIGDDRDEAEYPWIVFALDDTEYGINSKYVLSIEIIGEITPVVDAAAHCPGITRSRGDMIDLLDLRVLFGLGDYVAAKENDSGDTFMMMVLETDGKKRGVIVDRIVSVEYISNFIDGVIGDCDEAITSQFISQLATREKLNSPVLILNPRSLNTI